MSALQHPNQAKSLFTPRVPSAHTSPCAPCRVRHLCFCFMTFATPTPQQATAVVANACWVYSWVAEVAASQIFWGPGGKRLVHVCAQPGSPTRSQVLCTAPGAKSEPEPRLKAVVMLVFCCTHLTHRSACSSKNRTAASWASDACAIVRVREALIELRASHSTLRRLLIAQQRRTDTLCASAWTRFRLPNQLCITPVAGH